MERLRGVARPAPSELGLSAAPENRRDACLQLAGVEGLGNAVVSTRLQTRNALCLIARNAYQYDRNVFLAPKPVEEIKFTLSRNHEVKHDELEPAIGPNLSSLKSVLNGGDGKAV